MFLAKVFTLGMDISAAMNCYRYALSLSPDNKAAKRFLSDLLTIRGKEMMIAAQSTSSEYAFRSAKACFEESLLLSRDNAEVRMLKAVCHVFCDELDEALEAINKVGDVIHCHLLSPLSLLSFLK